MTRTYELLFIVRPDMADEALEKLVSLLETTVASAKGSVKSIDRMGKRRLAYMVRKFREGIYILMTIEGEGTVIHELERRLRVTEQVIKFLTVRVDEEHKRLEKIKALRDSRKKASVQPAVVAAEEAPAAAEAPVADAPAATV
jgi:small subunit ribosomal protein S6